MQLCDVVSATEFVIDSRPQDTKFKEPTNNLIGRTGQSTDFCCCCYKVKRELLHQKYLNIEM